MPAMAERGRNGSGNRSNRSASERTVYEPRLALRRIERALLALVVITVLRVNCGPCFAS